MTDQTHYGPKFEVTLKLDPGQLAELVELVMPLRMVPPPVDPETEAADLLAIQRERQRERTGGAKQERERIVACLRRTAEIHDENAGLINDEHTREALTLLDVARAIEKGLGSSS